MKLAITIAVFLLLLPLPIMAEKEGDLEVHLATGSLLLTTMSNEELGYYDVSLSFCDEEEAECVGLKVNSAQGDLWLGAFFGCAHSGMPDLPIGFAYEGFLQINDGELWKVYWATETLIDPTIKTDMVIGISWMKVLDITSKEVKGDSLIRTVTAGIDEIEVPPDEIHPAIRVNYEVPEEAAIIFAEYAARVLTDWEKR